MYILKSNNIDPDNLTISSLEKKLNTYKPQNDPNNPQRGSIKTKLLIGLSSVLIAAVTYVGVACNKVEEPVLETPTQNKTQEVKPPVYNTPTQKPTTTTQTPQESETPVLTEILQGLVKQYVDTQWPTDNIVLSSPFGPRLMASEGYRYDFHRGIDIPGERGDDVYAIADGEIFRTYLEGNPDYVRGGTVVAIRHTFDVPFTFHGKGYTKWYSFYMHLDSIKVDMAKPGGPYAKIKKGETIGYIGQTGLTEFDHLHLETRIGTMCSRKYQRENPDKACAKFFGPEPTDPHVNPLHFLSYPDPDSYKVEVLQTDPLKILVSAHRDELDLNEIKVGYQGEVQSINFDERVGIHPFNIDIPKTNGILIKPGKFSARSNSYKITFTFDLSDFGFIEVRDIWGKGIKLINNVNNR